MLVSWLVRAASLRPVARFGWLGRRGRECWVHALRLGVEFGRLGSSGLGPHVSGRLAVGGIGAVFGLGVLLRGPHCSPAVRIVALLLFAVHSSVFCGLNSGVSALMHGALSSWLCLASQLVSGGALIASLSERAGLTKRLRRDRLVGQCSIGAK